MDDQEIAEKEFEVAPELIDLGAVSPVDHKFDYIVGNQLMCSLHGYCVSITISPTAVLEANEGGELVLVEKAK